MTSFQLSLIYIFVMMFYLYFTVQYISKKIPYIQNKFETKLGLQLVKQVLAPLMLGFIIITSLFIYMGKKNIEARSLPLNNAYSTFYALSNSHKTLGSVYRACTQLTPKRSQTHCVTEMENKARYEGLSEDFQQVYNDLKMHIFLLEKTSNQS